MLGRKMLVTIVVGIAVFAAGYLGNLSTVQAVVLEKDATPVKMLLTDWGGVTLNLQGQEKFFKVWDKASGSYQKVDISLSNIDSFDIYGRNLVYTISHGSSMDVYLYHLQTRQNDLLSNSPTLKRNVKIYGDRVAWVDYGIGSGGIMVSTLSTGKSTELAVEETNNIEIDINDRYLAYTANQNGHKCVFVYDLFKGSARVVADTYADKAGLEIYGDKIVWTEGSGAALPVGSYFDQVWGHAVKNNALNDIWLYDISSDQSQQLTNNNVNEVQPQIWDHYVAWVETGSGSPDLCLLDLNSGTKQFIANTDLYEVQPEISDGYIAWITIKGNLGDLTVEAINPGSVTPIPGATPERSIVLIINGTQYYTDPAPYIKNDRTLVPMRRIFEILGASVDWNAVERSVTATRGSDTIKLYIGQDTAYLNGQPVQLDASPEIHIASGRTMVPVRFVSKALRCAVDWDAGTRSVSIIQASGI